MTTWGPSKKQTAKSRRRSTPIGAAPRPRRRARAAAPPGPVAGAAPTSRAGRRGASGGVTSATPPTGVEPPRAGDRRAARAPSAGREHEFIGIGLIAAGVLLGLAIYFNLAGPLGRGIETAARLDRRPRPLRRPGRASSPPASPLVRKGQSSSPVRLAIGWGLVGVAASASPTSSTGPTRRRPRRARPTRGGLVGALVGDAAARRCSSPAGAVVVAARRRHRRRPAHHPDVAAHDGRAHRPRRRQRRPPDRRAPPARRCATCRR